MRHVLRLLPIAAWTLVHAAHAYAPVATSDPVPWSPAPFVAAAPDAAERWAREEPATDLVARSAGGAWRATIDARTGVPGILRLTVPLRAAGLAPTTDREAIVAFAARHAAAFGLSADLLALDDRNLAVLLDGRLIAADFTPAPHGIPVEDARFSLRVSRGNVVLIETERLAPMTGLDPQPAITPAAAIATVLTRLGAAADSVEMADAGSLRWLPLPTAEGGLRLELAWRVALRTADSFAFWEARVDARTGELIALRDDARHACPTPPRGTHGQVRGGVLPRYPWETEEVRGLPFIRVRQGAMTIDADLGGSYPYPGGAGDSVFQAVPVSVACANCSNPTSGLAAIDTATGDVDFGTGGTNTVGNGLSNKAERAAFYHGGRIHALARKWLPAAQVPDGIDINVNSSPGSCNGLYSGGRIFLFPEDATCANTGESPSVIKHEWGHGLDAQAGPSGNWSEGMADRLDMLTHRDSRGAPGFYLGSTDGLREADETRVAIKVWPAPECFGEVHCLGEVYNQADWHLSTLLRADPLLGEETGWHLMEALFFNSVPQAGVLDPGAPASVYEAYANVLDALFGDGNVIAGVPFASHLNAAYQHHGLAPGSPYPEEPYPCLSAPVAPALTASVLERDPVTSRPRVTLSWTGPPVAYEVLRSETGASYSKLELATVPAGTSTYVDTTTHLGATYVYAVMPQLASGCYARMDWLLSVTVVGGSLEVASMNLDPAGDGILMPGETVDVVPTVRNTGVDPQDMVIATLEPGDPLITVVRPASNVGLVPGGASRAGGAWRVTLSAAAPCNGSFELPVRLESDSSCSMATVTLSAGNAGVALDAGLAETRDPLPLGNFNSRAEPGETVDLVLQVTGVGTDITGVARATTGVVTSLDPRITVMDPNVTFGDVPWGATVRSSDTARVAIDPTAWCGLALPLQLDVTGSNGCWNARLDVVLAGPEVLFFEDPENLDPRWSLTGDATSGSWQRADPLPVVVGGAAMPGDDATVDPGHYAWATSARSETPGLDDVDGGCTTLALRLTGMPDTRPILSYWRAFGSEGGDAGDGLFIEAFDPSAGQFRTLETLTSNAPFERIDIDLEDVFGYPPGILALEFRACDIGADSVIEAVVDEVRVESRPCQGPALPDIVATAWDLDDTASGNGNGALDPGETIDVRVRLANVGRLDARAVRGTLRFAVGATGLSVVSDTDTWPDLPIGSDALDVATFRIAATPGATCGPGAILALDYSWTSAGGDGNDTATSPLDVGARAPDPVEESLAVQRFDALPVAGWASWALRGEDDWQVGAPSGLGGDPSSADTGVNAWGTDLGVSEPPLTRDGLAATSSTSRLEAPLLDFRNVSGTRLTFRRWLDLGPGDRARVLVDGAIAWESPAGVALRDTAWTLANIDLSALVDGRAPVTLAWELETDGIADGGGWNLDTVEILGHWLEPSCGCTDAPPTPLGGALRVSRTGSDATLDWSRTTSDGDSFRVLRRVSARQTPQTGSWSVVGDLVPIRLWSEIDGSTTGPLVFFDVRPLNACGEE